MVLRAKSRIYKLSGGKYAIYIPKGLIDDSQFPFNLEEATKKDAIEIVIMPSKVEGIGKLLIKQSKRGDEQRKKVKDRVSGLCAAILHIRLQNVRYDTLRDLLRRHERIYYLLYAWFWSVAITLPIVTVWSIFTMFLGIPNDLIRCVAIWALIFILALAASRSDWKEAVDKYT